MNLKRGRNSIPSKGRSAFLPSFAHTRGGDVTRGFKESLDLWALVL